MKEQIYKICTQLNDGQIAVTEAQEQLLLLFSVSQQRELLLAWEKSQYIEAGWNKSKEMVAEKIDKYLANNCG